MAKAKIVDAHVHLGSREAIEELREQMRALSFRAMNIVATINRKAVNANRPAFQAKLAYPDEFYVFCGMDHSEYWLTGKKNPETIAAQVEKMTKAGADGFKLIEGKPTTRKYLPIAPDDAYFDGFFAECEKRAVPLLWHVADPEEFWDPAKTPDWALSRGWGYGPQDVPKETLYDEVAQVLSRHPKLRIIFAHFYFLSADLARARRFLDEHPAVGIDLAPGVEYLHNLSRNPEAARQFFLDYHNRIYFGTDLSNGYKPGEVQTRSGIVTRFLETDDAYPVPADADFLLGKAKDGEIRGIALPKDAVAEIEWKNFEKLAGKKPRRPDKKLIEALDKELEEKAAQLSKKA